MTKQHDKFQFLVGLDHVNCKGPFGIVVRSIEPQHLQGARKAVVEALTNGNIFRKLHTVVENDNNNYSSVCRKMRNEYIYKRKRK